MLGILETISPSELVYNGNISNHNKVRRPRPKFKVSFYLYFCCFWINVTQINFESIKTKIQRIISDSCFQLKSWFNVDARASSIPLLNFPLKGKRSQIIKWEISFLDDVNRKTIMKFDWVITVVNFSTWIISWIINSNIWEDVIR